MMWLRLTWKVGPDPSLEQLETVVRAFMSACTEVGLVVPEATVEQVEESET